MPVILSSKVDKNTKKIHKYYPYSLKLWEHVTVIASQFWKAI